MSQSKPDTAAATAEDQEQVRDCDYRKQPPEIGHLCFHAFKPGEPRFCPYASGSVTLEHVLARTRAKQKGSAT